MNRLNFTPKKNRYIAVYRVGSVSFWKPISLPFWYSMFSEPLRNGIAKRLAMKTRPEGAVFQCLATSLTTALLRQ